MHCRNKLINGSKKYHAATLTNDIASTTEVSTPAVMLGLSFANDIKKKMFSYMMLLTTSGTENILSDMNIKYISYERILDFLL